VKRSSAKIPSQRLINISRDARIANVSTKLAHNHASGKFIWYPRQSKVEKVESFQVTEILSRHSCLALKKETFTKGNSIAHFALIKLQPISLLQKNNVKIIL